MKLGLQGRKIGPIATEIIEKNALHRFPARPKNYPFVPEKGKGVYIEDVDGNVFLDFASGVGVCSTGHCHPGVLSAVKEQIDKALHIPGGVQVAEVQAALVERISKISPGTSNKTVVLTNSGTEAVEASLKLARYFTKKKGIVAFQGSFHGRTLGAMSVSSSDISHRSYMGPLIPEIYFVPYPYCYRCLYGLTYPECGLKCLEYVQSTLFQKIIYPDEIAAFIFEPIQGEGGVIIPPPEFYKILREITQENGILLIADEVQTGMGRTGRMFCVDHYGIEPDIITVAKGIASGLPLGAMIARSECMKWKPGAHGNTFGGNVVSCAAALATIDILEGEAIKNAEEKGKNFLERLYRLREKFDFIGDVRGKGLMIGIEIVKDAKTKTPDKLKRDEILKTAFENGLIILGGGASSIRVLPPLIISDEEMENGLEILSKTLGVVALSKD